MSSLYSPAFDPLALPTPLLPSSILPRLTAPANSSLPPPLTPTATPSQAKELQISCRILSLPPQLRPCLGAGPSYHRHHDPTRPPPRVRRRSPQWNQNLPRLGHHSFYAPTPTPPTSLAPASAVLPVVSTTSETTPTTPPSTTPSRHIQRTYQ
jgi:hypothetical protein